MPLVSCTHAKAQQKKEGRKKRCTEENPCSRLKYTKAAQKFLSTHAVDIIVVSESYKRSFKRQSRYS
jgi:hypothetical protein